MTTFNEQAAEEWIEKREDVSHGTFSEYADAMTPNGLRFRSLKEGFLAGVAHARKAIRIDPEDQSTWPPLNEEFLALVYKYKDTPPYWEQIKLRDYERLSWVPTSITHWSPIPEVEAE